VITGDTGGKFASGVNDAEEKFAATNDINIRLPST
jgi:hypothetical protein